MGNFRVNKILELFKEILIFWVIFFVPIFFALFLKTNNVFELNKIVLFRVLVLGILVVALLREMKRWHAFLIPGNSVNLLSRLIHVIIKLRLVMMIVLLFIFSLIISTFLSINRELSFFGLYDRQEGLLSYLYYIVFFILALSFLRGRERRVSFVLWPLIMSSVVVCVYGVLQALGMDPLGWTETTKMRVTATFGQPNNLGSYLLFVIPVTGYFLSKYKNLFLRSFLTAVLLLQFLVLYYSFSTSAWLGLICGMFVAGVIMLRKNFFTFKYISLAFGVALFLAIVIQFNPGILDSKISNLLDLRTGSTAARVQFWGAAWQGIKEKPILGHGLDVQQDVLLRYYSPDWAIHSNVNVQPSRAHNFFLDTLITQGILGFIAHLLLWGVVFYTLLQNVRNNHKKHFNLTLLTSFTAYFVYLQFNFPHVTTQIYFWLFLAILLRENKTIETITLTTENKVIKKIIKILIVLLLVFGIYGIVNYEAKKILADHYYMEMRRANLENRYGLMKEMYQYIKEIDDNNSFYNHAYIQMTMSWVRRFDNEYYNNLVKDDFVRILSKIKTDNFNDLKVKAQIYEFLASYDESNLDKAEESYKKMIELSPNMPLAHRLYANFLVNQEKRDEAQVEYDICLENLPSLDSPGLNLDHGRAVEREARFCSGKVIE